MRKHLFFALPLMACADPSVQSLQPSAVELSPTCDITIPMTLPANGARAADYLAPIEFHLSEPDPTATVIAPFSGVQGSRDEGRVITFTPSTPLAPLTTYTVGLEYCHGTPQITFQTGEFGAPLEIPTANLEGRTFALGLAQGNWPTGGEGLSALAASLFSTELLLEVVEVEEREIALRVGLPAEDDGTQDYCSRTLDLPVGTFDGPRFRIATPALSFGAFQDQLAISNLVVEGSFNPEGTAIGSGTVTATIDTRSLYDMLAVYGPELLCDMASDFGVPCTPCEADGAPFCFTVSATHLEGQLEWDLSVDIVEEAWLDPRCESAEVL